MRNSRLYKHGLDFSMCLNVNQQVICFSLITERYQFLSVVKFWIDICLSGGALFLFSILLI